MLLMFLTENCNYNCNLDAF